jgi:hypothetical protein
MRWEIKEKLATETGISGLRLVSVSVASLMMRSLSGFGGKDGCVVYVHQADAVLRHG